MFFLGQIAQSVEQRTENLCVSSFLQPLNPRNSLTNMTLTEIYIFHYGFVPPNYRHIPFF